jgi:hypothetical protein
MNKTWDTDNSFSLQKVIINVDNLDYINEKVDEAMESYSWIYQNEGKHDVLVKIHIKRKFNPKNIISKSPNFKIKK